MVVLIVGVYHTMLIIIWLLWLEFWFFIDHHYPHPPSRGRAEPGRALVPTRPTSLGV